MMSPDHTSSTTLQKGSDLNTAWYQRPITRRTGIGVMLSAVAGVVGYNYLNEDVKWRNQDWEPTRNQIQDRMKVLNLQLSEQFLSRFPEEKSFVDYLNRGPVLFSNFLAEMYGNALNTSDKYTNGAQFLETFKRAAPLLLTGRNLNQALVEKVNSLLGYGSLAPLLGKVLQTGKLFQREEVSSLGEFERNAIDYLALKSCVNILDVIEVSRKSNHAGLRRLAGYATPGSSLTNSEYAYVDLASGTNIEEYMPYVLEIETRRPIILLDISPYIVRYWTTLAQAVGASNLEVRNLDIHKISSDTLPDKVGTFRFQNVGAWVPDLTQKWTQQLMDLLCVGGQVVFVQPFVYLMNKNASHPEEARFIPFLNELAPDPGNFHLIRKFAANINNNNASQWKIRYGYVGKSGKITEKQFGYIVMPDIGKPTEVFENVVSFERHS